MLAILCAIISLCMHILYMHKTLIFVKQLLSQFFQTCRDDSHYNTIYGKTFEGENFRGFHGFSANRESFPLNHLPCTVHNGVDLMHRKNFPVNSAFCAQPRKFSPSKVLPYTV